MTDRAAAPEASYTGHRLVRLRQGAPEQIFPITARELVLGSDSDCGVPLDDTSASIIEDLDSANGARRNGL